jgi:yecA family protein
MTTPDGTRLGAEELIDIERTLDSTNRDSSMTLEELDGYCTALVVAQIDALRETHLLDIFDLSEDELVKRLADTPRQKFVRLLDRQLNQIQTRLHQGDLAPLIRQGNTPSDHPPGYDWAAGFARGMDTEQDAFEVLDDDDEEVWEWVDPIYDMLEDPPRIGRESEDRVETMIEGVVQLYAWLQVKRA